VKEYGHTKNTGAS